MPHNHRQRGFIAFLLILILMGIAGHLEERDHQLRLDESSIERF